MIRKFVELLRTDPNGLTIRFPVNLTFLENSPKFKAIAHQYAKRIRSKYPGYDDLSDEDLTSKTLKKYPNVIFHIPPGEDSFSKSTPEWYKEALNAGIDVETLPATANRRAFHLHFDWGNCSRTK